MTSLIHFLTPKVEELCVHESVDEVTVLEYLKKATLVGVLPQPPPIFVRKFVHTDGIRVWLTSYLWVRFRFLFLSHYF